MAHILVVDSEPAIRSLIAVILQEAGHLVVEAPDGPNGLERVCKGGIELVLTDLHLPGVDGAELISQMRSVHPRVKIVALSGGMSDEVLLTTERMAGVCGLLPKPFTRGELLAEVARALRSPI